MNSFLVSFYRELWHNTSFRCDLLPPSTSWSVFLLEKIRDKICAVAINSAIFKVKRVKKLSAWKNISLFTKQWGRFSKNRNLFKELQREIPALCQAEIRLQTTRVYLRRIDQSCHWRIHELLDLNSRRTYRVLYFIHKARAEVFKL